MDTEKNRALCLQIWRLRVQNLFIEIILGLRHKHKQLPPVLSHCAHHWIDRYYTVNDDFHI